MADYKLPKCWLGKSLSTIKDNDQAVDKVITEEMVNMSCLCSNEMQAFFCGEGHLTECHVGMRCDEAECSHLSRYDDGFYDGEEDRS